MSNNPIHASIPRTSFNRYHGTSFQMPSVRKPWIPRVPGWQISPDHPLALFISMLLILLVTYFVDRRTRQGFGRRHRRIFHMLMFTHGVVTLVLLYYTMQE